MRLSWSCKGGKSVPEAAKKFDVAEQIYYRWEGKYGALRMDQAKRLRDLAKENARLYRFLADAELDNAILREAASRIFGALRSDAWVRSTFGGAPRGSRERSRARPAGFSTSAAVDSLSSR